MPPKIIGDHPLARDPSGKLRSRIGTVFPRSRTIVTLPGIHAMQRMAYLDLLAAERAAAGQPPMSREEESAEWEASVDLVFDEGDVLIRPDPENMPLAFEADEVLQEVIPKHRIKFLNVGNEKVRKAVERQGECWRIALLPRSLPEMIHMIAASKVAVGNREIYYYDRITGTHFLTCQEFAGLESLDDAELRRHLIEIRELSQAIQSAGDGRDPVLHGRRHVSARTISASTTSNAWSRRRCGRSTMRCGGSSRRPSTPSSAATISTASSGGATCTPRSSARTTRPFPRSSCWA